MSEKTVTVLEIAQMLGLASKPVEPTTGPCWSCDAANSPGYCCTRGHEWAACAECDTPAMNAKGLVEWDNCPECQGEEYDATHSGPCGHGAYIPGCDSCGDRHDAKSGE